MWPLIIFLDVESTGSSNEFYDKFSIRHHISVIVKELWKDLHHKCAVLAHSRSDEFVRFVNMLINDTTFLLDESLNCLKSINEIQQLMKNRPKWEALTRVSSSYKIGAVKVAQLCCGHFHIAVWDARLWYRSQYIIWTLTSGLPIIVCRMVYIHVFCCPSNRTLALQINAN